MVTHEHVRNIFAGPSKGDMASFWPHVEPNVDWTVKGTHCKVSGRYKSIEEFQQGTRALSSTWAGPLHLVVQNVIIEGNQAAVELKAVNTQTKSGDPFPNEYTWVLGFNDNGKIATVRAYMDTDLVNRVIEKNPQ
ncbi:ketosteroid isomerase [Fusarium denticulatum]|uniref:Ketosteroid isomerase n=1 Tax=Fusarium denticulatum TaxID=48507 RepID=A0A8H5XHI0_9HYPO|nr:ketosteroid isomerase [Fusarium denticulatum]